MQQTKNSSTVFQNETTNFDYKKKNKKKYCTNHKGDLKNCINKIIRVGHFGVRGLSLSLEMRITYHLEP